MKDQRDVDWLLARAQVGLAMIFTVGIFALVFVLVFYHNDMSQVAQAIISSVIAALVTVLTLQMNFFYARQRPAALPDPNSNTTMITPPPTSSVTAATITPLPNVPEIPK